jgi:hypothetical protein
LANSKSFEELTRMRPTYAIWMTIFMVGFGQTAVAQTTPERVQWSATFDSQGAVKGGSTVLLEINGAIQDGWHVYALTEPSGGPTPLRVTLDENDVAQAAGTPTGTKPLKHHDPSFNLETQFYTHSFTVRLPVTLKPTVGPQRVPVSVRFQTCSNRECQPPTTTHLSVVIDVLPAGT